MKPGNIKETGHIGNLNIDGNIYLYMEEIRIIIAL
jgi:hypothetical protein